MAEPDPVDHGRDTPQPRSEQLVQYVIHEPARQIESLPESISAVEPQIQHAMTAAAAASDAGVVSSPTHHGDGPGEVEVLVQPRRDGFPSTRIVGQPLGGR